MSSIGDIFEERGIQSILWTVAKSWTTERVDKKVTFGKVHALSMVGEKLENEVQIKNELHREAWLASVANMKANERAMKTERNRLIGRDENTDDGGETFIYLFDPITRRNTFENNKRLSLDSVERWLESTDDEAPQKKAEDYEDMETTDCVVS